MPEEGNNATTTTTTTTTTTETLSLDLSNSSALSYAGCLVSAVVLLISLVSTNEHKSHNHYEYGIAVSVVAMFFALLGWACLTLPQLQNPKIIRYTNYFLFLWCFVGACVLTFGGPFKVAGNGFFGAWGLAIFATMAIGVDTSSVREAAGPLTCLFASAVVVLIAISSNGLEKNSSRFGHLVYGLVLSCLTILLVGAMIKSTESLLPLSQQYIVMGVFAILWVVAACFLTFSGPFLLTGNGYFGAWGGALASVFAMNAARQAQSAS